MNRFDSRDGYYESDVDFRQQESDWYEEESYGDGRKYNDSGYDMDWHRFRDSRRGVEAGYLRGYGNHNHGRDTVVYKESSDKPQF